MTSDELIKLNEIYDNVVAQPFNILNVFIDYYGEENVELNISSLEDTIKKIDGYEINYNNVINKIECADIIVHFPEVRIENENGAYVDIRDLWVKVPLTYRLNGNYSVATEDNLSWVLNFNFKMTCSTYCLSHLKADYMHSHCPGVPWVNNIYDYSPWMKCCLGTGPIKNTKATLCMDYDIDMWRLFCVELDKYVHTESLSGGPYRKISSIGTECTLLRNIDNVIIYSNTCNIPDINIIKDFIIYFIKNYEIPVCFINKTFAISENPVNFRIKMSKIFIEWYNDIKNPWNTTFGNLFDEIVDVHRYKIDENKIYCIDNNCSVSYINSKIRTLRGLKLFKFKGNDVIVDIIDDVSQEDNSYCYLLDNYLVGFIATTLIQFLNMMYDGKK